MTRVTQVTEEIAGIAYLPKEPGNKRLPFLDLKKGCHGRTKRSDQKVDSLTEVKLALEGPRFVSGGSTGKPPPSFCL